LEACFVWFEILEEFRVPNDYHGKSLFDITLLRTYGILTTKERRSTTTLNSTPPSFATFLRVTHDPAHHLCREKFAKG